MSKPVYILNGPNLNLLGKREPEVYGTDTLSDIMQVCRDQAEGLGLAIEAHQSNAEADLIEWVHEARTNASAIIINAGAYTHTSIALHDALRMADVPIIEVHLSNVYQREPFRHKSYISPVAHAVICGFGGHGYEMALEGVARLLSKSNM